MSVVSRCLVWAKLLAMALGTSPSHGPSYKWTACLLTYIQSIEMVRVSIVFFSKHRALKYGLLDRLLYLVSGCRVGESDCQSHAQSWPSDDIAVPHRGEEALGWALVQSPLQTSSRPAGTSSVLKEQLQPHSCASVGFQVGCLQRVRDPPLLSLPPSSAATSWFIILGLADEANPNAAT